MFRLRLSIRERISGTEVCVAWPVRRETFGYLPSRTSSLPVYWHQLILLGDRGTCVCVCEQLAQGC